MDPSAGLFWRAFRAAMLLPFAPTLTLCTGLSGVRRGAALCDSCLLLVCVWEAVSTERRERVGLLEK